MNRSAIISTLYGVSGASLLAVLRLAGVITPKPVWVRPLFIVDVCTLSLLGIIITYLIVTRGK